MNITTKSKICFLTVLITVISIITFIFSTPVMAANITGTGCGQYYALEAWETLF